MALDCDVVAVGCGPVGVMAALRCAQQGLSVISVDRSTEIYPHPRAIGMDDEIQRVFQAAGLLDRLDEVSSPVDGAEFVDVDGNRLVGLDLPPGMRGALGLPPIVMFEQPLVEGFLRHAALDAGVDMRLGVEATAVEPDEPAITIRDVGGGDETTLRSKWVIAADGASSTVRRLIGIDVVDQGFDQQWLVVDATALVDDFEFPHIPTQVCSPERVVTLIPGHETRRRWEFQLHDDETRAEFEAPERIAALLAPWGGPDQLRLDRTAVYRFHALVAERFRAGNVFLAGDAAHQMPPFNGQGMCSGIRDAQNLAWRLAMVDRGLAGEALLDGYDTERRPHSARQVEHSADAGKLIDALAAGVDVDTAAGYGGGREFPHLEAGLLDGDHPAVGRQLPQPVIAGAPFDDLLGDHFTLLCRVALDPAVEHWWADRGAQTVVVDDRLFGELIDEATTVIVRPDRYVAAVTDDLAATTSRLAAHLGVPFP